MNTFLSLSEARRRTVCEQTQDKLGLPPATIEKDFPARNLKYMRRFSATYPDMEIVQQDAAQIPWFHNCEIVFPFRANVEASGLLL